MGKSADRTCYAMLWYFNWLDLEFHSSPVRQAGTAVGNVFSFLFYWALNVILVWVLWLDWFWVGILFLKLRFFFHLWLRFSTALPIWSFHQIWFLVDVFCFEWCWINSDELCTLILFFNLYAFFFMCFYLLLLINLYKKM